jgi:hypothetical protein
MTAMSKDGHLVLQANIICLLLGLIGVVAVSQHSAWFH